LAYAVLLGCNAFFESRASVRGGSGEWAAGMLQLDAVAHVWARQNCNILGRGLNLCSIALQWLGSLYTYCSSCQHTSQHTLFENPIVRSPSSSATFRNQGPPHPARHATATPRMLLITRAITSRTTKIVQSPDLPKECPTSCEQASQAALHAMPHSQMSGAASTTTHSVCLPVWDSTLAGATLADPACTNMVVAA
jgi:hypothetical protein